MRYNREDSSVTPRWSKHARAVLVTAVCILLTLGGEAYAQAVVPDRTTGLTASSVTHDSVTLTWDAPSDGSITGHQVLRRSRDGDDYGDGLGAAEFAVIMDDTGTPATSFTDTSVTARTRYVYQVKARNPQGRRELQRRRRRDPRSSS